MEFDCVTETQERFETQVNPKVLAEVLAIHADPLEEAASLWESLSQNHQFIDGNKRTSFATLYTLLSINGARTTASAAQTAELLSDSYERIEPKVERARAHSGAGATAEEGGCV